MILGIYSLALIIGVAAYALWCDITEGNDQ